MKSFYLPDDLVCGIKAPETNIREVHYAHTELEAQEKFPLLLHEANWIFSALTSIFEIRGNIYFVAAYSKSPFQVKHLDQHDFVVLIDPRAFDYLLTLSFRIQSLDPLASTIGVRPIAEARDYKGKFLLDIAKDIVFRTEDFAPLINNQPARSLYRAAFIYIVGHELAHISHGHLEFRNSAHFVEFSQSDEEKNLTLRALEMDADSSATSSVFEVFERLIDNAIDNAVAEPAMGSASFKADVRTQYLAGMFTALLLIDTFASNHFPSAHPIGYARFLTMIRVMQVIYGRADPLAITLPEEVRRIFVGVFEGLSGSLNFLGHPIATNCESYSGDFDIPQYTYNLIGVSAGLSHLVPLYGRWSRLRPYLEKFQRGGTLAPALAPPS